MNLPPMTLHDAVQLYDKIRGVGPEAILLMSASDDERALAQFAMRALVLLGDQLVATEERCVELADANLQLVGLITEQMNGTAEPVMSAASDLAVAWTGSASAYRGNMEAINAEIAQEFCGEIRRIEGE